MLRCAAVLATIGDLVRDVVVWVDGPVAHASDTPVRIRHTRGGSAANVAAFASAAGAPARFIGCVGADSLGDQLVGELMATGVDVRVERHGDAASGSIVVLVEPGGERTMYADRGAATRLTTVDPAWLDGIRWLHVPAYSLIAEPLGTATRAAIEQVRGRGEVVSVDLSSVGAVTDYGAGPFLRMLGRLAPAVVFANDDEGRLLADTTGPWTLVRKRGPDPVRVTTPDGRSAEVIVPPVPEAVDSTGAGDAFAAGYLVAATRGADPVAAAEAGIALAARTLAVAGASLSERPTLAPGSTGSRSDVAR